MPRDETTPLRRSARRPKGRPRTGRRLFAFDFARVLNEEARELAGIGVDVVQFDEPAFNVYMDDVKTWGLEALHAAIDGVACATAVHICYG